MWGQSQVNAWRWSASIALFTTLIFVSILNWQVVEGASFRLAQNTDVGNHRGGIRKIASLRREGRQESGITLISFLQTSVKRYGEKKVASSIHELAQHSLYDLVWLLAGDLEPWLIYDMYKMYNAASSDERVLSVYERFRAGQVNRSIVPEVFALDKKYNQYDWYKNVRTRLLESVDKYMAGSLVVSSSPPKIEFGPDGKPIIEGKPETVVAAVVAKSSTTKAPTPPVTIDTDEDPDDGGESSDLDLEDFFGGFIS